MTVDKEEDTKYCRAKKRKNMEGDRRFHTANNNDIKKYATKTQMITRKRGIEQAIMDNIIDRK